jgi:hypothetical protein
VSGIAGENEMLGRDELEMTARASWNDVFGIIK